jgi:hypothetical protein
MDSTSAGEAGIRRVYIGSCLRGLGFWGDAGAIVLRDYFGIAHSHLTAVDRGLKKPGVTILFTIARLHGEPIEWLLTGSDGETR